MTLYAFGQAHASQLVKVARREGLRSRGQSNTAEYPELVPEINLDVAYFRNDSGETIPAYGVILLGTPFMSNGILHYSANKPNTTFQRFYLVNGPDNVAVDKFGWGTWLTFPGKVLYDSGTPAPGESWGPKNGQWSLTKWRYGFTIHGGNDTTALTTKAVQEPVNAVLGQTDGAISSGSSGTVEVYDGNKTIITSTTLTSVENQFADVGDNKKVICRWLGGDWFLFHSTGNTVRRGVTDGAINKGSSGTVSRYTDGTDTDSTINDTVTNSFANVGSGKKVAYVDVGGVFYMIAAECPLT